MGAPTIVENGKDVAPGPFKVLDKFRPVLDIFKVNLFDRRTCNDEPIVITVLDVIPFEIDPVQIGIIRVRADAGYRTAEINFDLDGGVAQ